MKRNILLILIILWMIVIFTFSSADGKKSTHQSDSFISATIMKIINIFDNDLSPQTKDKILNVSKIVVRKLAHMTEYFILALLTFMYIKEYNLDIIKCIYISLIICILYASSDEIHQLFIEGRSGRILDVLIDTLGACIYYLTNYLYRRKRCLK